MKSRPFASLMVFVVMALFCVDSFSADKKPAPGRKPASAGEKGSSTIEFDEKVVEGMGMKDLSSARHVGENRMKSGDRLIRERTDFRDDMKRALREVPWVQ